MFVVKNLRNKKHLNKYYRNVKEMKVDFVNMAENTNVVEGIDYEFVKVDGSKLKETHKCLNCGRENVKKYYDILSVADNEINKACKHCAIKIHKEDDPYSLS